MPAHSGSVRRYKKRGDIVKKTLLISMIVILIIIITSVIIGRKERKKMEMFFSPVTNKEEYINYTESKNFSFEYSIEIKNLPGDEQYDQIHYEIMVINNMPNILEDFMTIIRFEENMIKYIPSPFFYVKPVTLYAKENESNLKNYMTSYGRLSFVRRISKLSKEEYKEFMDSYKNLYLDITWNRGKEKVLINNPIVK